MKIKLQQFLGQNHSWSICGQNLARALLNKGHEISLKSTNGYDHFPNDLKPFIKDNFNDIYDLAISYTAPINWSRYLYDAKNKFAIFCYEWPILPISFAKNHLFCDKILAPSNFARDIFIANKVPAEKVVVVPHGINLLDYDNKNKYPLKTKKKYKIFVNIGQPHLRKNIAGMFEAYGKAFTKQDDVCLVAKIHNKKKLTEKFDVNANIIYSDFCKKFKDHAEVELITEYVPNIIELYNACDIVYTLSYCEGFYMPGIEAMAANKINIAPNYGGQLDFMNDKNSLLVEGKIIRASSNMQYWTSNVHNTCFDSNTDDAAHKLQKIVKEYEQLKETMLFNIQETARLYTWKNSVRKILELI